MDLRSAGRPGRRAGQNLRRFRQRLRDILEMGAAALEVYPPSEHLDRQALESAMLAHCGRFLDLRARRAVHLRPISPEEAIRSYTEYAYGFFGVTAFSEEQGSRLRKPKNPLHFPVVREMRRVCME
ncbi:hypothetical protein [Saccharibacillus deserti]|uniref:hypothetical protein n=1 Tax=Saccharibacillus deserti TaxID=1634444 RepID=UPI0015580021|nr:hypothetical protein [Saccharibacillus deserti]